MSLWQAKRRIEQAYQKSIQSMFKRALSAFIGIHAVGDFQTAMSQWAASKAFGKFAESLSRKMITSLFDDVGKDWRSAARHNSKGRQIYERLIEDLSGNRGRRVDELVRQNAELIKTLPSDIAGDVAEFIRRETIKGRRPEDIEHDVVKMFPDRTQAKAKLIARTECSKTQTALIQSDAEEVGADWYFWRATKDSQTRGAHAHMDGIICSWRDPPNPEALFPDGNQPYNSYHPGCTFNCRCYPEPIVTIYQLTQNSYKVHQNGRIVRMTKAQVKKLISI